MHYELDIACKRFLETVGSGVPDDLTYGFANSLRDGDLIIIRRFVFEDGPAWEMEARNPDGTRRGEWIDYKP